MVEPTFVLSKDVLYAPDTQMTSRLIHYSLYLRADASGLSVKFHIFYRLFA
jgi:hypothetical protein